MDTEIQIISDDDGLAVIGEQEAVEDFLAAQGLPSKDLGLSKLSALLSKGSALAQAGADVGANYGRWMKLTEESAKATSALPLVKNSTTGFSHATLRAPNGQFAKNLQFMNAPGVRLNAGALTNPALLSGAAGLMAQLAMEQAMQEVTQYLASIDEKVYDVLRAQKDAVLSDMLGVEVLIEESLAIRDQVGVVSEVTWSKVQATSETIHRTQQYALRQLDALATKLETGANINRLTKSAREAESTVQEWLAVVARCSQLQDAIAVLELDRVLQTSPEELDQHRLGLKVARQNRLERISETNEELMGRINSAAGWANRRVLMNPVASRNVVHSCNVVAANVTELDGLLGLERGEQSWQAKRWIEAAGEAGTAAMETGAAGFSAAKNFGDESVGRIRGLGSRGLYSVADRLRPDSTSPTENETSDMERPALEQKDE